MKHSIRTSLVLVLLSLSIIASTQVQTAKFVSMVSGSNGYYEYLPEGYQSSTQNYPLIVFCHGVGEIGDGSLAQLPWVLRGGLPKIINDGSFPVSFTVNGRNFKFIVISPQFNHENPTPADIEGILDYAVQHYRVNVNRVYLTGLSMGGGATWDYAKLNPSDAYRLAAIVPVCGRSVPNPVLCRNIANTNLPVWATHNSGDPSVPVTYTNDYVDIINQAPAPNPMAKKTIFPGSSHDAWTKTYDPNFTEDGMNIYQWMLQYQRFISALPVSLSSYTAYRLSPSQARISWTVANESNNRQFTIERSANGIDFSALGNIYPKDQNSNYSFTDDHPARGVNYYRLSQTDLNGKKTYFSILKLNFDPSGKGIVLLEENPARDRAILHLNHQGKGKVFVSIISTNGVIIKQWEFVKPEYELTQPIDLSGVLPGSYIINAKGVDWTQSQEFIKK